jgi:hypothetical protein
MRRNFFSFLTLALACWVFILLLIFSAYYDDSNWATVAITGILVAITAYYALSTEKLLQVNAHYAMTTERILEVNRDTLRLLNRELELHTIERKSAKVEEITRILLIPLDRQIKDIKNKILDKRNVVLVNPPFDKLQMFTLLNDIRYPKVTDYIKSRLEAIKITENYDESIFKKHIGSILKYIEEYDGQESEYKKFIAEETIPMYMKHISPFFGKNAYSNIPPMNYHALFYMLVKGKRESFDITPFNNQEKILNEYSSFIDEIYSNNLEFKTYMEKKIQYETKLIEILNKLENEVNLLLSSWMNIYHIPIASSPIYAT